MAGILLLSTICPLYLYLLRKAELQRDMFAWLQTVDARSFYTSFSFTITANQQVNDPAFAWEDTQQEFTYKGNLYDVISIQVNHNRLNIKCVPDKAEDQLLAQMQQMVCNGKASQRLPHQYLLKSFFAFYIGGSQKIQVVRGDCAAHYQSFSTWYYPDGFTLLSMPPPKTA